MRCGWHHAEYFPAEGLVCCKRGELVYLKLIIFCAEMRNGKIKIDGVLKKIEILPNASRDLTRLKQGVYRDFKQNGAPRLKPWYLRPAFAKAAAGLSASDLARNPPKPDDVLPSRASPVPPFVHGQARGFRAEADNLSGLGFFWAGGFLLFTIIAGLFYVEQSRDLRKQILGTATTGFEFLNSGRTNFINQNFPEASVDFNNAAVSFASASAQMKSSFGVLSGILSRLPLGRDYNNLLEAGSRISSSLESVVAGITDFEEIRPAVGDQSPYLRLRSSREKLSKGIEQLSEAIILLEGVNPNVLPDEYRDQFLESTVNLVNSRELLNGFIDAEAFALNLFGGENETYLLIFQNNNEARPTGGFIGTYGLLYLENGEMRIGKIESIYNLEGGFKEKIAAPGPLQRQVSPYWGMRDSNWFVDFPASSVKILDFFEKITGVLPDGILSFTPDVFEKFLEITGPVSMPEYNTILTPENFRAIAQSKTSIEYDREENEPKKFLADFAPRMLEGLKGLDNSQWAAVVQALASLMEEKQILMYSTDGETQNKIIKYRLAGEIKKTSGDYLAIFHSNVGGGKTDRGIIQKVEKKISIDSGGLAIVKLKITRSHQGYEEKYFPKNLDFMRVLVPESAKLLAASGFDDYPLLPSQRPDAESDSDLAAWNEQITRDENTRMYIGKESGYTVFNNWLELNPGEAKSVELTYELQFDSGKRYTHLLQTQPGAREFDFLFELNYLPGNVVYFYPDNLRSDGQKVTITETVKGDRFYGVIGQ